MLKLLAATACVASVSALHIKPAGKKQTKPAAKPLKQEKPVALVNADSEVKSASMVASKASTAASQAAAARAQGKWASATLLEKLEKFQNLGFESLLEYGAATTDAQAEYLRDSAEKLELQGGMLLEEGTSDRQTSHKLDAAHKLDAEHNSVLAKAHALAQKHLLGHGTKTKGESNFLLFKFTVLTDMMTKVS